MNPSHRTVVIIIGCLVLTLGSWQTVQEALDLQLQQSRLLLSQDQIEADSARLAKDFVSFQQRTQAKQRIAEEVIAGRLTLARAVECFRELNKEAGSHPDDRGQSESEDVPPEWVEQHVFAYIEYALRKQPDEASRIRIRLEAERQVSRRPGS